MQDLWLPKGYELGDGSLINLLLYSGVDWQIFDTNGHVKVLLARAELARKWVELGFIDPALIEEVRFGLHSFQCLRSDRKFTLSPIQGGSIGSKVDGLAFAQSLKESRHLSSEASFHDAIYVEQYSRLLPTWTLTEQVDDQVVLGTMITGGVPVSAESFRRLTSLTGWMSAEDLVEVVRSAGFDVPANSGLFMKRKPRCLTDTAREAGVVDDSESAESKSGYLPDGEVFKLPGRPQLENFFNEHVVDIISHPDKYHALGIVFPSATILHGPPGCGKTFAVEKLVDFIDWPSYSIDANSVGSPYIHDTSKKIAQVFDKAIDSAPSVIIIDEMEAFLTDRGHSSSSGLHHVEEMAEFLRRIPEAIQNKVLIIAMTNMFDMIDPAIRRRGRFDHVVEVGMPSREEVMSLLDSLLDRLPKDDKLNLKPLLDALTGKALSDSAFVVRESARLAAKVGKNRIDQDSLEQALSSLPAQERTKRHPIGFV